MRLGRLIDCPKPFFSGGPVNDKPIQALSMGYGTWAGNSISENLNDSNFSNVTHLVTTIPEDKPTEAELFGDFWARFGR